VTSYFSFRIGSEYQATILPKQKESEEEEEERKLEELLWRPDSELTDEQIDQFIIISRSVGTFARALDCSSSVKQPSLHMSAAAASRDITVFHAYQVFFLIYNVFVSTSNAVFRTI
jgi:metastasis-associated protein MTA